MGTRRVAALHRQPLQIDILDTSPFEPIGRQSLALALVFVGGIVLSLLLTPPQRASLQNPLFWATYGPLALVPVPIFFLNMRPSHAALAEAKRRELAAVGDQIRRRCGALLQHIGTDPEVSRLAAELQVLRFL